ncbi:MAG TPA: SDR family oxidoreductase [Bacillota bacterium]|nr:SDR family oxidoreductase [Bacillota bacterium]
MNKKTLVGGFLLGVGVGAALGRRQRLNRYSFSGRTVVITGGSRGLGLVLARQLAQEGAKLVLLARDAEELHRAEAQLTASEAKVLVLPCDVRFRSQVSEAIRRTVERFGQVDMLINNAGVIQVAPLAHMTVKDFKDAMAIHLYAPLYTTLAVLPYMRQAGEGRIVNIASIGGKIAVPHLLPYTASKFALVGFSDGLRAELRRENIFVTTVCPSLMRTGSPRNAYFKGQHPREYAWFAIGDSLPLLSMDAERAARKILGAARRGSAQLLMGVQTKGAVLFNDLFPGATAALTSLANRLLPNPVLEGASQIQPGHQSQSKWAPSWLTRLSEEAARKNNELPLAE